MRYIDIPKELRDALGIDTGNEVEFERRNDTVVVREAEPWQRRALIHPSGYHGGMLGRRRRARTSGQAGNPRSTVVADVSGPTETRAAPVDSMRDLLDQRLASVEQELAAVAGGASLCAISRSAGSVPGAKYLEGRMVAIREIRRAARTGRPLAAVLDESVDRWRSELARVDTQAMGSDWRAYRAGGVDELESLREFPST